MDRRHTHPAKRHHACKTQSTPAQPPPHHQITFEARCPPVQPQDPVRVCPPRWARFYDEHLQPSHEQRRGSPRGCHGKQACTKGMQTSTASWRPGCSVKTCRSGWTTSTTTRCGSNMQKHATTSSWSTTTRCNSTWPALY